MVPFIPFKLNDFHSEPLSEDQVHIWYLSLKMDENALQSLFMLLSVEERERATGLRYQHVKERYTASRGLLRWILGRYLDEPPERIEFVYGPHGKPGLPGYLNRRGITFNMSHSHDLALIGIGLKRGLGVDIEKIRDDVQFLRIAERFFSPYEFEVLKTLPGDQVKYAFFNCWTRKEAYIKARGETIASSIGSFSVTLKPKDPVLMMEHQLDPRETERWTFKSLDLTPDYKAALVAEGHKADVKLVGEGVLVPCNDP